MGENRSERARFSCVGLVIRNTNLHTLSMNQAVSIPACAAIALGSFLFGGCSMPDESTAEKTQTETSKTLVGTRAITGRVVDAQGNAMPDVTVRRSSTTDEPAFFSGEPYANRTRTDVRGRFVLPPVPDHQQDDGEFTIEAHTADSFASSSFEPTKMSKELVLELKEGPRLTGVTVDEKERPLAGAQLWARTVTGMDEDPLRDGGMLWEWGSAGIPPLRTSVKSDADGRFTLRLARPGRWLIIGLAPGRNLNRMIDLDVESGSKNPELRLLFEKRGKMAGRILTSGGRPIVGARVIGQCIPYRHPKRPGAYASAMSQQDGSFLLEDLKQGLCRVYVSLPRKKLLDLGLTREQEDASGRSHDGWFGLREIATGTMDVEFRMEVPGLGHLSLSIAPLLSGPESIHVKLTSQPGSITERAAAHDGKLRLKNLLSGSYQLQLQSSRLEAWKGPVVIKDGQWTELGLLQMTERPKQSVRFVDSRGQPVEGAWVLQNLGDEARNPNWEDYVSDKGREQFDGRVLATSDAQGVVELSVFSEGRIDCQVFKPGYMPEHYTLERPSGPKGSHPIQLRLSSCAELQVFLPRPISHSKNKTQHARWQVRLREATDSGLEAVESDVQSLASGRFERIERLTRSSQSFTRFLGLPAGRYILDAYNSSKLSHYVKKSEAGRSFHRIIELKTRDRATLRIR